MDILELLEGPHEWGYRDPVVGGFFADDSPYKAAEEIARLRKQSTWVSVLERLPESGLPVLVYTPANKYGKMWVDSWSKRYESPLSWSSATVETGSMWESFDFGEVTHWMPLPEWPDDGEPEVICGNCESVMPIGCGGVFKDDGDDCRLNVQGLPQEPT